MSVRFVHTACAALLFGCLAPAQVEPPLTLDDLFSGVDIRSTELSPSGTSAVFVSTRADWKNNRFRDDLWLWRENGPGVTPLTQSGHDSEPRWSPDEKYIAFISDRPLSDEKASNEGDDEKDKQIGRVWIIPTRGGEPSPLYRERLKVHSFAWSRDGSAILFSAEQPLSKQAAEEQKEHWKDVQRWRAEERGDLLLQIPLIDVMTHPLPLPVESSSTEEIGSKKGANKPDDTPELPKNARVITRSPYAIGEIVPTPNSDSIAFLTNSISGRLEHPQAYEIYLVDARSSGSETPVRQLTHNQALERQLHWSPDGATLYFGVFAASGSLDGPYKDAQGRLYSLAVADGRIQRLGKSFSGSWSDYSVRSNGSILALGQLGTETQLYSLTNSVTKISTRPGTYEHLSTAQKGVSLLFTHSAVDEPSELFFSGDAASANASEQVTHSNQLFNSRALPKFKTYQWKSSDGRNVEGVLLYPPGHFGEKHLRTLTLIHGGPADADGNKFGADWYSWAQLAAANGWLVFQPNIAARAATETISWMRSLPISFPHRAATSYPAWMHW